jgi:UDP-glucose 4-epimerase
MKIIVSKKAIESNFKTKVNATIRMAKQCAEQGQTNFYINIPNGSGYSKYDLINRVEELTESTVYAGHRAVSGESIKFSIAEEGRING